MSEHRRKPPQPPQGGGRAAARRSASGGAPGRRATPRANNGSPADPYDEYPSGGEERPYGGRAEARRAAQRSTGRRRAPEPAGRGPGRGRGRPAPPDKKRIIDYPRAYKTGAGRWVPSWKLVTGLFLGFVGSLMIVAGVAYYLVAVPDIAKAAKAQNNVYYWSNGSQMVATGGETNRQIISYDEIPASMRYAVMSAENKTFETDKGVDPMGIARALFNMAQGGQTQGGSTITQQYVKNARLDDQSQTLTRKFKELFISIKVGAQVPKPQIMAGYLNTAYYGRGAYGIQAAARTYYGKDANDLNASQTAFLAALLKGATYYDPAGATAIDPAANPQANRQRATARWKWILDEEVKDHRLSAADRATFTKFPEPRPPRANAALGGQVGYLVDLANGYILHNTKITQDQLQQGGYEIHTTFDKKKVEALEKAVNKVRKAKINPKLRPDKDTYVQFGGASVDPTSGAIKAIYGGEDATKHFTNNADQTGAQVGSTFKPFVLAAAMRDGVRDPKGPETQGAAQRTLVSPKSLFVAKNKLKIKNYDGTVWTDRDGKEWLQTNDGGESYGEKPNYMIDLREAMRVSANSPYVQLGMDVGLDKVRQSALDAGLLKESLASSHFPSFSIGTSDPSAIRMAGAYGTFADEGQQHEPFSVKQVKHEGAPVYTHANKASQAYPSNVANNVTDVLRTVVDKGTGTNAQLPGREVAGKTGTTDGNKSAWFVGYTPQLSTAITMYRLDDNEKSKKRQFLEMFGTGGEEKIHGASFPSQIWRDYMMQALQGAPIKAFTPPQPIGEIVGATPSPSPTPSVTSSPSESPSPSASNSPSPSPSKTPGNGNTCGPFDWKCNTNGGQDNGGTDTGTTGGTSPSPSPTDSTGTTGGKPGGNGNGGGFFGGPAG
ncbi:transglycosylase domain-containing protein [Streptomyces sp. NPDC002004]